MAAKIIDGNAIAKRVRGEWKQRADALKGQGITPGLAVILIGTNPASHLYVRSKVRACGELGLHSEIHSFPAEIDEETLLKRIQNLNTNGAIHGILIQLPLPAHLNVRRLVHAISVNKDVDGFHLYNVGGLVVGDNNIFPPCTPYGVQRLLEYEQIPIEGQNVVVVGASNIVGKPMAHMLMAKDATVSICHIKTRDLAQYTILADILIVAAGCSGLITAPMVKRGAVVVDVGINRLPDGRLVGDVDFERVKEKAAYITPVPGGVGPMTITMLLCNTIAAAERSLRRNIKPLALA